MPSSRGSFRPRDRTCISYVSCIGRQVLYWEALHAEYIMQNAELSELQAGIKTAGRNDQQLRYTDDITSVAESEEELKSLLMRVKEKSEKAGLKLNMKKKQRKKLRWYPVTSLYGKQKGKKWKQ